MHAPPFVIAQKHFKKWVAYVMRNLPTCQYKLVHGMQLAGNKTFGPCGPNPFYSFSLYGTDDTYVKMTADSPDDYDFERYVTCFGFEGEEFMTEDISGKFQVINHVKPTEKEHLILKKD